MNRIEDIKKIKSSYAEAIIGARQPQGLFYLLDGGVYQFTAVQEVVEESVHGICELRRN